MLNVVDPADKNARFLGWCVAVSASGSEARIASDCFVLLRIARARDNSDDQSNAAKFAEIVRQSSAR